MGETDVTGAAGGFLGDPAEAFEVTSTDGGCCGTPSGGEAAAGGCCGTGDAGTGDGCCTPEAKAEAVASGAGCCG